MEFVDPTPRPGHGSPRTSKKLRLPSRPRRSRKMNGLSLIEALEDRRLLTIYNPLTVPLLTAGETTTNPIFTVATFDSPSPSANLSAQVFFAPGTTSVSPTTGTITPIGQEFVPGIGNVEEYAVSTAATFGQSTGPIHPQFTVSIHDATDGITALAIGTMQITDAPLAPVSSNPAPAYSEGTPATLNLSVFSDGNSSATASDFVGTIDWGDGSPVSTATIASLGIGQFVVSGTHTYTQAQTTTIKTTVTDVDGGSTVKATTGTATVTDAAFAAGTAVPVNGVEGQQLNGVPVATFRDNNTLGKASDITATINWGDGSPLDTGVVSPAGGNGSGATFVITGSHKYTTVGVFPITATAVDKGGVGVVAILPSATITQTPIVVDALPWTATAATPTTANKVVGTFTDAGGADLPGTYSVTVDWGDGTTDNLASGVVISPLGGNTFNITAPSHTYAKPGFYALTLTVADADPALGIGGSLVIVAAPTITALPAPLITTAVEGQPITTAVSSFTVADPGAVASGFVATIDWGDGTPASLGTISQPGGIGTAFLVSGTHTYAEESAAGHNIQVVVTDQFGSVVSSTTVVTAVADAPLTAGTPLTVSASENKPLVNVPVATFIDTNPTATAADFTASIVWGDGTAADPTAQVALIGGSPAGAIFAVYGSHTYTSTGSFGITTTVTDQGGAADLIINPPTIPPALPQLLNATVAQSALSVNVLPVSTIAGIAVPDSQVIATFTDSAGPDASIADYTATINWGDGTTTTNANLSITPLGGGSYAINQIGAPHAYALPGIYSIQVTVVDNEVPAAASATGIGGNIAFIAPGSTVVLAPVPAPPVPSVEGQPLFNILVASFTDSNVLTLPGEFLTQIDWGDGSPQSVGFVAFDPAFPVGTGHFIVTGNHTYNEESLLNQPYKITVTVTDDFGGVAPFFFDDVTASTVTLALPVEDAFLSGSGGVPVGIGVPVAGAEAQPLNDIPVATFLDANPLATAADFSAAITWGDASGPDANARVVLVGGVPSGPGLPAGGARFAVYGSHTYAKASAPGAPYAIGVTVQDDGGNAIAVIPIATTATIGAPTTPGVIASFIDHGGADPIASYSAVIDWGDGKPTSAGTIAPLGGGAYSVIAPAHTYSKPGFYAVVVTVTDADPAVGIGGNLAIVQASTLTVTAASGPIVSTEGTPLVATTVATFTSSNLTAVPGDYTATIDWGDGSPISAGSISQPGGVGTTFVVRGNHTYAEEDTTGYTVTVVISDGLGNKVSTTTTADVNDATLVSPTGIAEFANDGQVLVNAPLGTFADNNSLATAADFTATINWGDGTPSTLGSVTLVGGNATQALFSVSGTHLYTTPGVKTVVISVVDDGGQSTTITTTVTVAANPLSLSLTVPGPLLATEGIATAGGVIATFTDAPGDDPTGNYTVTINYGDGSPLFLGATVVNNGNGTYNVIAPPHTFPEEGTFPVTVSVADIDSPGAPFSAVALAVVKDAALTGNNNPIPIAAAEGIATGLSTIVTFSDANPLGTVSDFTATIDWGDGTSGTGIVSQPGGPGTVFIVSGNHTFLDEGTFPVTVHIVDVGGSTTTATAIVVVSEGTVTVNPAPVAVNGYKNVELVNVDVATFTSGNPFDSTNDFVATISWGDGTPATAGVITEDASHVFHVAGSHTYTQAGSFFPTITISEADSNALLGQTTATVTIQAVPLIVTAVPISATEGTALPNAQNTSNGTVVATFINTVGFDPIGAYTATIDFGNGVVAAGTILPLGGPNFEVVIPSLPAVTYAEEGTYTVKVTVTDNNANGPAGFFTALGFATATVKDAPLTADPAQPVVAAFQQTPLVATQVAKFTDGNSAAPVSDFTATIDWGDGSPQSAGTIIQPGGVGTAFFVTGNHTFAQPTNPPAAPYAITVTINDDGGSHVTTHTVANVTASTITGTPVTINGTESQPIVNATVAFFSDSGIPGPLSSYSASINWGDQANSVTFGQIVPLGGNNFAVVGTFTYPEENIAPNIPYSITVTINHNGSLATTVVSHANIADAPLSGVAIPVFATEGLAFNGTVGIFTDTDPAGTATDYTATISWGDGTSSTGKVVANGASFLVLATDPVSGVGHVFNEEGTFPYSVTVRDIGGATFTSFQTATVADAGLTATGINTTTTEGPLAAVPLPGTTIPTFNLATFTDSGNTVPGSVDTPSAYTATINWGDGTVNTGVVGNPTIIGTSVIFPVTGQHLYKDEGTFLATITIKDEGGATTQTSSVITITDAALTAGPAAAITQVEGVPFLAQVATFSDADLAANIADYSATINWGDGTSTAGIVGQLSTAVGSPSQFAVTGSHTYAEESAAGTPYAITVSIKDVNGGNTATATATATVLDAPISSQGTSIQGVEGNPLTANALGNGILIATIVDNDPTATAADFTSGGGSITLDWGDGSGLVTIPAANITAVGSSAGVTFKVFGGGHIFKEEGSYQITVTATDAGGAATVAHSEADIADAPLFSPGQTAVNVTEGTAFTLPVAAFFDLSPFGTPADFKATIDWGDGSPRSTGTIIQPGGPGNPLFVTGQHVYTDSLVNGGNGTFKIIVNVTDDGGSTLTINNVAVVADVAIDLTGMLNTASDSGASNEDGITNVNQPNFVGHSEPNSVVQLFATPTGGGATFFIGQVQADGSGAWSINSSLLADGSYVITARALDKSGFTVGTTTIKEGAFGGPLVIDTVGPKVTDVVFARLSSEIIVMFQDERSGMDNTTVIDASNYSFTRAGSSHQFLVTALPLSIGGGPTAPETVGIVIDGAKTQLRGGKPYTLTIRSGGIRDIAGNALDGEFFGFFPSGNNKPGGDFVARLDAIHRRIFAPGTVIGPATPLTPPGRKPSKVIVPIVIPPAVAPLPTTTTVAGAKVHGTKVHDRAIASLVDAHPFGKPSPHHH